MKRMVVKLLVCALVLGLGASIAFAQASPAFDSASDIEYGPVDPSPPVGVGPGWWDPSGFDNGGFGFLPWLGAVGAGGGGFFMGTSTGNGDGLDNGIIGGLPGDGDIDTFNPSVPAMQSWGMFSGFGSVVEMVRPFTGPMLPGETFTISLDNGFVAGDGSGGPGLDGVVGLTLQTAVGIGLPAGATAFEIFFVGGDPTYYVTDGTGTFPIALPFTDEGFTFSLTVTAPGAYAASVTLPGGAVIGGAGPLAGGGAPIVQARIFSFSNPGGPAFDMFANSMSIVPEPTTFALVGLGLLGGLALRRKKA
jgi:hypothetical protein